jgi:hypothetical protein
MNTILLLADAAQVADGKLFILGGGWSVTGPGPLPSAVAIKVTVDGTEFDAVHHWELFLEDGDGHPVLVPTGEGESPLQVSGDFTVPSTIELPAPGATADVPIAVNFSPLPLTPGARYVWRFTIDGETPPGGYAAFSVRPSEQ